MLFRPFAYRWAGIDQADGRWRFYLVLPSRSEWDEVGQRIRRALPPRVLAICAAAFLLADQPRHRVPSVWNEPLVPEAWGHFRIERRGSVRVRLLRADLAKSPIEIIPVSSRGHERPTEAVDRIVTSFQRETGRAVLGAINGGFFDMKTGLPVGFLLRDGDMDFFNMPQGVRRSMVGFTKPSSGRCARILISSPQTMPKAWLDRVNERGKATDSLAVHHVNVAGGKNAFELFSPSYGTHLLGVPHGSYFQAERSGDHFRIRRRVDGAGRIEIPKDGMVIALTGDARGATSQLPIGGRVRPRWTLPGAWKEAGVAHGLLAGPRLLENGRLAITARDERLHRLKSRDRVVLGTTGDGEALLLWLHQDASAGMLEFDQTARVLLSYGVRDAIALDGGGSSAVVAITRKPYSEDRYVFTGRPVANALLVALPLKRG